MAPDDAPRRDGSDAVERDARPCLRFRQPTLQRMIMATVLLTWELGAGSGHLVRLSPIARGLLERGHQVFAAIRDVERAKSVLPSGLTGVFRSPIAAGKA